MPVPFLMTVPFFVLPSEKQKRPDSSEHLLLQKIRPVEKLFYKSSALFEIFSKSKRALTLIPVMCG